MICENCQGEIHPARLAAIPHTVTCKAECSDARLRKRKAEASAASHRRSGYRAAKAYQRRKRKGGKA